MSIVNTALSLKDLPPPPLNRAGWPWTEQSQPLPDLMSDGSSWPRITIVTPSYNQGEFIEETIRSVLLQGYPNLEYIIIDGGSTDNSVEVIKKYEQYLAYWVSESDEGQSHALNKGFRQATGQLIGWQNSDDYYHPNAFKYVVQESIDFRDAHIIYGYTNYVDRVGKFIKNVYVDKFELQDMLPWPILFNQSTFFRKEIFDHGYFVNDSLKHCMDYDLFWRLALDDYKFHGSYNIGGCYREHINSKAANQIEIAQQEFMMIYAAIYMNNNSEHFVKNKAIESMRLFCNIDFNNLKLNNFRHKFRYLFSVSGLKAISLKMFIKYLLSFILFCE